VASIKNTAHNINVALVATPANPDNPKIAKTSATKNNIKILFTFTRFF